MDISEAQETQEQKHWPVHQEARALVRHEAPSYEKRGEWKIDDAEDLEEGGQELEQEQEEEVKEGRWKQSIGNITSLKKKSHVSAINHNRRRSNNRRFHGARPERWRHTRPGLQNGDVEQSEVWSYTV